MIRAGTLARDEKGAVLAEFALLLPILLLTTFAIIEFALVMWQQQQAAMGATRALRLATTRELIAPGALPDCGVATAMTAGSPCRDDASTVGWVQTCTPSSPGVCNSATLQLMSDEIERFLPQYEPANLVVELEGAGLGFVGFGKPVPLVTVRLTGLTYDFIALGNILGLGSLTMLDIVTAAPAEDLQGT